MPLPMLLLLPLLMSPLLPPLILSLPPLLIFPSPPLAPVFRRANLNPWSYSQVPTTRSRPWLPPVYAASLMPPLMM